MKLTRSLPSWNKYPHAGKDVMLFLAKENHSGKEEELKTLGEAEAGH